MWNIYLGIEINVFFNTMTYVKNYMYKEMWIWGAYICTVLVYMIPLLNTFIYINNSSSKDLKLSFMSAVTEVCIFFKTTDVTKQF